MGEDERPPITELAPKRLRWRRAAIAVSVAYLLAMLAIWALLRFAAETFWPATALLYLPRWPWILPAIPVGIAAWLLWRPGALLAAIGAIVVLGPVGGFRFGTGRAIVKPPDTVIRVVTLNIQNGKPNLPASLGEIERFGPDVMCSQEVDFEQPELIDSVASVDLAYRRHDSHFWTASRWPLELVRVVESQTSYRDICAVYRVLGPGESAFHLVNVHLSTARHGLTNLRPRTVLTGVGLDELRAHQRLRLGEIAELSAVLDELPTPLVVCGDFNMPVDSPAFAALLAGRRSAFDVAGFGYGYTVPNEATPLWPRGWCWLRVDHVLASKNVSPIAARPGTASGSDHRALLTELRLPKISAEELPTVRSVTPQRRPSRE